MEIGARACIYYDFLRLNKYFSHLVDFKAFSVAYLLLKV